MQSQLPGGPFVIQTGTAQRQLLGGPFVNETVSSGRFVRHYPNAIISISKLTGAYTDIDEDPAAPDGSWLTFDASQ